MLLILEIWLTVAAWRRGWKGLALIPAGAVLALGFFVGASGVNPDDIRAICIVGDLLTCVLLGIMAAHGRMAQTNVANRTEANAQIERLAAVNVGHEPQTQL